MTIIQFLRATLREREGRAICEWYINDTSRGYRKWMYTECNRTWEEL